MNEDQKTDQTAALQAQQALQKLFDDLVSRKDREGIRSVYANLVNLEMNDLDLKLLFGQTSQLSGNRVPEWHTAVTMTWAEAKIFSFFLQINLAIYEQQNGPIKVPDSLIPPPFRGPSEEADGDSGSKDFIETVEALRREVFLGQAQPHKQE
ncbi:MAG TPA: DUF3467 domain-containing protein [Bryobacteraceae bacterium]|jgi:hypothetical protein